MSDEKYGMDWQDKEKVYTQRNHSSSEGVDGIRKEPGPIPTQLLNLKTTALGIERQLQGGLWYLSLMNLVSKSVVSF